MKKQVYGFVLLVGAAFAPNAVLADAPFAAERVQMFFDPVSGEAVRHSVRVIDLEPALKRDFLWTPDKAGVSGLRPDGLVEGRGTLTWRAGGAADYDSSAVLSTYIGEMRGGLPEGRGALRLRTGERFEGDFVAGKLHGRGMRAFVNGDRYEGEFRDGVAHGLGRLASASGAIHQGEFRNGAPHGKGRYIAADGSAHDSEWTAGRESGPRTNVKLAAGNVGGLVRAQEASGGDAAKMDIGFAIDARLNEEAGMQYQHLARDDDIAIYPVEQEINDSWAGTREVVDGTWPFDMVDWVDAPAFVEMGLASKDGGKVKIDSLDLQVTTSEAVLKPFLALEAHRGCVGFRPTFNFVNFGWGEARDAKLTIAFANEDGSTKTREYTSALGTFDEGIDASLRDVLKEAGVDVEALETTRFPCPSADDLPACKQDAMNKVGFGEVAQTVFGEDRLTTTAMGKIDYSWVDSNGQTWPQSEPFKVDINLARIEYPAELAECGDGFPGSPEALRYIDVDLPLGKKDYTVAIPVRGNKTIKDYTARLKMHAERTSYHSLRGVAKFADGSVLQSKPVSFYFFRPRETKFTSQATPAACYLSPDDDSC